MNTYYILWTYSANYSDNVMEVKANSAEEAAQKVFECFSLDFSKHGTVYVMENTPYILKGKNNATL